MRILTLAAALPFALTACASHMEDDLPEDLPVRAPQGECDATKVQSFVGQIVSTEIGAEILTQSGAARLRWGPPNSAMTMDYRPDRVNVFYDEERVIERITCG